jgi:hypothetical protein
MLIISSRIFNPEGGCISHRWGSPPKAVQIITQDLELPGEDLAPRLSHSPLGDSGVFPPRLTGCKKGLLPKISAPVNTDIMYSIPRITDHSKAGNTR